MSRRLARRAPRPTRLLVALAASTLAAHAVPGHVLTAQESHGAHAAAAAPLDGAVRLIDGLGRHSRPVATANPLAQRWFDQGLRLAYAFNHAEALRSFREAARIDPRCAMCQWGTAYVLGPNINAPMDTAAYPEAHAAVTRALTLAPATASRGPAAAERALIEALATRYAPSAPAGGRASLDSAYATAMAAVAKRWPGDADVATLHAESVMQLSPWAYWTADRRPLPGTAALLAALERALARDRAHPGACHFYIHAVEAAYPARALPCAEGLAARMPAAGHIVHMPGHIYLRVGRYSDAIAANRHAVHADESYLADAGARAGFYAVAYYPHNFHFLGFAATMAGRSADAVSAARDAARRIPAEMAAEAPELQLLVAYRTSRSPPSGGGTTSRASRCSGGAAHGDGDGVVRPRRGADAHRWRRRGRRGARQPPGGERGRDALPGRAGAADRHARARGRAPRHARRARGRDRAAREGGGARGRAHLHGAALLAPARAPPARRGAARRRAPADATRRYREDLERFPENVWSLAGLTRSLAAEGRPREAAAARERLQRATRDADVQLAASRF
jgi:tetratricopeptide (TPR) repeat protein